MLQLVACTLTFSLLLYNELFKKLLIILLYSSNENVKLHVAARTVAF